MSDQTQTLRQACKTGTVADVAQHLEAHARFDQSQRTELFKDAIEGNNLPILQYLINKFKDERPPPWQADYTVIMAAGEPERLDCFKLLHEANPSATTAYLGHTGNIAGLAILGENIPLLKFLLGTGLDPNTAELMHQPAVLRAVQLGSVETLNLLLDHGATVKGTNALGLAVEAEKIDTLKALVEKGGMDINTAQGSFADDDDKDISSPILHLAVRKGNAEIVRVLVKELGADLTIQDSEGKTALQRAQEQKQQKMVKQLTKY